MEWTLQYTHNMEAESSLLGLILAVFMEYAGERVLFIGTQFSILYTQLNLVSSTTKIQGASRIAPSYVFLNDVHSHCQRHHTRIHQAGGQ